MQLKEDELKYVKFTTDLTKVVMDEVNAEIIRLDRPDQIYGKMIQGPGTIIFKNGNVYVGEIQNGMLHGNGKITWPEGIEYEGEFTFNSITGQGKYSWSDGSTYVGQVKNGLRNGDGKLILNKEQIIYEGQWTDGLKHGKGVILFANGACYKGEFAHGSKTGYGKMTYPSGNYYEGQFYQDKKQGQGTMNWINNKEKYFGEWKNNIQNGWGTHIWLEQKQESVRSLRNRYEGQWLDGDRHGIGIFYYANSAKYIGEWENNVKQGLALFITDTGGIILGLFNQDRLAQVYALTENEEKNGIIPREIAPNTKEDNDFLQEQVSKVISINRSNKNSKLDLNISKKSFKDKTKDKDKSKTKDKLQESQKDVNKDQINEKLAGINSPNNKSPIHDKQQYNQVEVNIYALITDFSDIFNRQNQQIDKTQITQNIHMILLRHNSSLRNFFKFFSGRYEIPNENSFAMNLQGIWKILRDGRLLNNNYTTSTLDRFFYSGIKNRFYLLNHKLDDTQQLFDMIEKNINNINLDELSEIFHIDYTIECNQSLKDNPIDYQNIQKDQIKINYLTQPFDIHNSNNIILYRHFVDIIVRIAFLKYNNLVDIHRTLEHIILNKLTPLYERKIGKLIVSLEEESQILKQKLNFEDFLQNFKILFEKHAHDRFRSQFGIIDQTVTLNDVFHILNQCIQLSDQDKNFIVQQIEKYFDPDENFNYTQQSLLEQSSSGALLKEEKQKRKTKIDVAPLKDEYKDRMSQKYALKPEKKWTLYQDYELNLYEFTDLIMIAIGRKIDLYHHKEEIQKKRITNLVKKLLEIQPYSKVILKTQRIFPITRKDLEKEQLKEQRRVEAQRLREQQQLNEQLKMEEYERNLMALEDQNISSDYGEDESDEET